MTVPGWNAQQFHERMQNDRGAPVSKPTRAGPVVPRSGRTKKIAGLAIAAVVFGAMAVAATHDSSSDPEQIGVCHATGSQDNPYVWLVVDDDSFEHGHHRNHEGDFFRDLETQGCGDDVLPEDNVTIDNATLDNATAVEDAAVDAPVVVDDNSTEVPVDDGAEAPVEDNTTEAPEENVTAEPEPLFGDAWVSQESSQDDFEVVLSLTVGNGGDGNATDVILSDQLPDLRRSWHLGGEDSDQCTLAGTQLDCWFGTLAPGETRQIELQAYTDRMPCGFSQTNTASVSSTEDAESRNDASSAGILARAC